MDVGIVIVNYNTSQLLQDCLQSILDSQGNYQVKICVVDNASADDSVSVIQANFSEIHLIINNDNVGFAQANNQGLRYFKFNQPQANCPRYALLLNPDTKLTPTALSKMISFMDTNLDCGAVGPKLVLLDGSLDLACRRSFPTPEISFYQMIGLAQLFPQHLKFARYNLTFMNPDELAEVDSVVGACMMVRAEALAQAGLLDEVYFMYGEDLDWAFNIKKHGWKIYYNPAAFVWHVKRAASRSSGKAQIEFYRAMEIFYQKHYAAVAPWWLHWLVTLGIKIKWALTIIRVNFSGLSK